MSSHTPHYHHLPLTVYERRCQEHMAELTEPHDTLVPIWLEIGRANPWIAEAWDPPFDVLSFFICRNIRHLADNILQGNWCLGKAFVLDDICFINQINGGDEWLTIKGRTAFDSLKMQTHTETRAQAEVILRNTVARIQRATEQQCAKWDY